MSEETCKVCVIGMSPEFKFAGVLVKHDVFKLYENLFSDSEVVTCEYTNNQDKGRIFDCLM